MGWILQPRRAALMLAVVVVLSAAFLLLYRLGSEPLQDYDEATYAEVAHEAAISGNQASFTLFGTPYFRKPPLLFWMIEASNTVTTHPEFGARLPSALAALALIALVMAFVLEAGAAPLAAVFAGAILATTGAFIEAARQARFDTLVSFFNVAALYAFLRALRGDRRYFLLFGACLGLAILSKGVLVMYALAGVLGIVFVYRQWRFVLDPYFWGGTALGALIVVPWHLYETLQFGLSFWHDYVGTQVLDRVQQNLFSTRNLSNEGYALYLVSFAAPWSLVWCANTLKLPYLWKTFPIHRKAAYAGVFGATLCVLAILFITKTKAYTYLVPLYPFAAITIALSIEASLSLLKDARLRLMVYTTYVTLVVFGFSFAVYNGFHLNGYYGVSIKHAQEEKDAAMQVLALSETPVLYEYGENDIGTIQFYTGSHPVYLYSADSTLPPHAFIILKPSDRVALNAIQSGVRLTDVYTGSFVTIVSARTADF